MYPCVTSNNRPGIKRNIVSRWLLVFLHRCQKSNTLCAITCLVCRVVVSRLVWRDYNCLRMRGSSCGGEYNYSWLVSLPDLQDFVAPYMWTNIKVKCTLVQALRLCTGRTAHRRRVMVYLYPFLTTALEGGEGSASGPGRSLPPGKTRYPLYRSLGGPQGRSG